MIENKEQNFQIDDGGNILYNETVVRPLYEYGQIQQLIQNLASDFIIYLNSRNLNKVRILGIAKACIPFLTDFSFYTGDFCSGYDLIHANSYVGTEQSEKVKISYCTLSKKEQYDAVLILDTMLDTGRTMKAVYDYIKRNYKVKDIITMVLLKKKLSEEECVFKNINFVGWNCLNLFLVGYGLDYKENFRTIPSIYNYYDIEKIAQDKNLIKIFLENENMKFIESIHNKIIEHPLEDGDNEDGDNEEEELY